MRNAKEKSLKSGTNVLEGDTIPEAGGAGSQGRKTTVRWKDGLIYRGRKLETFEQANSLLIPLTQKSSEAIRCPYPEHDDSRAGSARLWPDHFYCFVCCRGGDALDYFCATESLSVGDALRRLGVTKGRPFPKKQKPTFSTEEERLFTHTRFTLAARERFPREWAIVKVLAPRRHEAVFIEDITAPGFLNFCRRHGLDPVLIHDLCIAIREAS